MVHAGGMPSALLHVALLASVLITGCGSTVIGGGGEGGSGGGGDTTAAPSAGPGSPTGGTAQASAIALYEAEMIEAGGAAHCSDSCASPDTLLLIVSSEGASCSAPDARPSGSPSWILHIGVPLEMQAIGTYDLSAASPDVFVATGQADSSDMSGVVTATGGFGFSGGTLEIIGLDATSVTFRIEGVLYDGDGDGQYVASRCGAATPPSGA
jgi:hypothetical protein